MSVPETTSRSGTLTTSQQFLAMFDKGPDHGPFGPRHVMSYGARITGPVDSAALRDALHDVVVRHEALRTTSSPCCGPRWAGSTTRTPSWSSSPITW